MYYKIKAQDGQLLFSNGDDAIDYCRELNELRPWWRVLPYKVEVMQGNLPKWIDCNPDVCYSSSTIR